MNISVIIPAYNEELRIKSTLEKLLEYINKNKFEYEIIVVDDGSKDRTVRVVEEFNDCKIRLLVNNKNFGKGYSVKRGVLSATRDYILFTDADLSTPISELDNFIKYISEYDIIIASRRLKESKVKNQPFYRQFPGKIFPLLVEVVLMKGVKDTQCGFKLFKSEVAKRLFQKQELNGFCFDVEILYWAKKWVIR